jgi:two-component system cell cycle sensor histidine kinase/response regulator CckA
VIVRQDREGAIKSGAPGWSLRNYMALFMVVLLAVAAVAAFSVRTMSEQDARQAAVADANFAADRAAAQIKSGFDQIDALSVPLAKDPSVVQLFASPTLCNLGYAPLGAFTTGHIDLIRLDGSIVCSSQKGAEAGALVYGGQSWLSAVVPTVIAPVLDTRTGNQVVVVTYPVTGKGAFVWFLDLVPLGPHLSSQFGSGVHQLEFLITSASGQEVLARSVDSAKWVGRSLKDAQFASASFPATIPDLSGTRRIYGGLSTNAAGWHLYVGADEAAALAIADLSASRFLVIILAGVGAMSIVVFVVYRRVAEPVRRLSLVMRGSKPGQAASVVVGTGAREVTDLAEDFDVLMATVKRELADRLNGEQKALNSERNYRSLFEGHPQPMWLYDLQTLAFLRVNDAAIERYGYSREEFLAMTIKDIRPREDLPKFLELVSNRPDFDKSGPWTHQLKDGSTVQVLITSHAVNFGEREARFVLAEDLTESQRLELELHQSQARADATAALGRAKDEMISMVSHEMRTPLASIVGFTELLSTRAVTDEQRKEYLSVMLQEGHRLTSLINDFLDLRRIEGGHLTMRFAPADVSALVGRAVALFGDTKQMVTTRIPKDLPLVRADSDSIFRVIANLLSNARKYSPNGGPIVVSAAASDGMVEVSVQDEGLGIPTDDLPHLFQKFFRVDTADRRAIRGTGLGLAISKNIVEAHGGKIGAASAGPGKGSVFYFTLPVGREQAQTGDVLVVEDDSGFAHLLQAELAARDLTSIWAADAETAEHLMSNNVARAVVLDLLLPGLSGEAFLQHLRQRHGLTIPVVVVTLKDLEPSENLALQKLGVTAVLRKGPGMAEAAADLIENSLVAALVAS